MAQDFFLCRLEDVPDGDARGFAPGPGRGVDRIIVVRRGERVWLYGNRCPHLGTPLNWMPDRFLDREGRHLVCATHGAIFAIEDGRCLAGPCRGDELEALPHRVCDGEIRVSLPTDSAS